MSKRKHISVTTKLASALLMLGDISYEDSKLLSAEQIISLYQFDHGVRHENGGPDEPWNLRPRLIKDHREKTTKIDIPQSAKARRIDKKWSEFTSNVLAKPRSIEKKHKWPKRALKSRNTFS